MADNDAVARIRNKHSLVVLSLMCRKVGLHYSAYVGKTRDAMARRLVQCRLTPDTLPAVTDTEVDEHRKTELRFRVRKRVPPTAPIDVQRKRERERDRATRMATEEARKRRRHNDDDSDSDSDWSGTSSDTGSSDTESDAVFSDTDDDDDDEEDSDATRARLGHIPTTYEMACARARSRNARISSARGAEVSEFIASCRAATYDRIKALASSGAQSVDASVASSSSSAAAAAVSSSSDAVMAVASSSAQIVDASAAVASSSSGAPAAAAADRAMPRATSGAAESGSDPAQTPLAASASSSAPSPSERRVYYYWIGDGGSYTLEQITAHIQWHNILKSGPGNLQTSCGLSISGLTNYHDFGLNAASITKALQQSHLIRDVSRTNGDKLCPISCDKYKRPHLLSLNGRSYSEDEITKAIASTLKCGNSLRLEDVTIEPEQLPTLRLYPNHGLPGWDPIVYTEADLPPHPPFDAATASRRNIFGMSAAMDAIAPAHDTNGVWDTDIRKIFREAYLPHRRDTQPATALCDYGHPPLFRDFTLREVAFPRAHPKHPAQFVNVKFDRCVIYYYCYCGPRFAGCLFENCTFIMCGGGAHTGKWRQCSFTNCDFMFVYKPSDAAAVVRFLSNGGPVSDCRTKRVPEDMITATQMASASVETLRRRIGIALGRVAPLPADRMEFKALVDDKWVVAMSPAATE